MAGIHGLEQVVAAFISNFSHDDAVRAMAESGGHELTGRHGDLARNGLDGFPTSGIGMRNVQLGRLLDDNDALLGRNVIKKRLHEGGLSGTSSSANESILALSNKGENRIP